ncbi:hypothetical protein TGAMA5MH_01704 [Trichoderma gamsii]|uniref:Uncharacterized protein n=1 Tax=Trichoderma gamsii TaxID=398673 RepID=A0A2K0TMM3_9HYPO|nr:hypothetical protein TGAMA5MH_01704 [Trichoderma gamsii]
MTIPTRSEPPNRPEVPILKRNGFQMCKDAFTVNNIKRVSGPRLLDLLHLDTIPRPADRMIAELEATNLFSKAFFAAQLTYYGIPFSPSVKSSELQALLRDEVCEGNCDSVPESVVELEAALRREYEPLYRKWESDFAAWSAEKERLDDENFDKCETPSEQAYFDIRRFLDRHYLTDGKPDRTKTPETLVLNTEGRLSDLSWKTRHIPGLYSWSSTCNTMEPVTCFIGWNGDEIKRLGKEFDDREREAEKARRRSKWDENMEAHKQYIARTQSKNGNTDGEDGESKPLDLSRLAGSYVIRCDAILDGWDTENTGDTLTMDVAVAPSSNGMLVAAYNLGIIRGTMTLSLSDDALKEVFDPEDEESEDSVSDEEDENNEDEEDDEDKKDDEDGSDTEQPTSGKKRKASLQQEEDEDSSLQQPAKKLKTATEPTPSRRVYLRLEGYETGNGEELHVPDPGYIDFTSNDCIAFEGLMKTLTYVGNKVKFEGYKISDEPQREPEHFEYVFLDELAESDEMDEQDMLDALDMVHEQDELYEQDE